MTDNFQRAWQPPEFTLSAREAQYHQRPAPEDPLHKLAFRYHLICELFDRKTCACGGQPGMAAEHRAINQHARQLRAQLVADNEPGITGTTNFAAALSRAIRSLEHVFTKEVPDDLRPHEWQSRARYLELLNRVDELLYDGWPVWPRIRTAIEWAETGVGEWEQVGG